VWRHEKDLPTLLEAFAACASQEPHLFLLLVGGGPEGERLKTHAARLGILDRCTFEPEVADVVPWMSAIDIYVLPSLSEALPNSLIEAMACGCACVASRVGGIPEIIDDGQSGLLFEGGNSAQLADRLRQLVSDASMRQRFRQRAVEKVETRFSLDAAATRLTSIYHMYTSQS
jgi:glycosyltransferase involved in cell wall biosynthesis